MATKGRKLLQGASEQSTSGVMTQGGSAKKAVKDAAFSASREDWGGATIHPATGKAVTPESGYAVAVRDHGQEQISVPHDAPRGEFDQAMQHAITQYAPQLGREGGHLGVFHDNANKRVDIDPVHIVPKAHQARNIGAYTHATGGAYNFATGDAEWTPHVK
jgi:hypothetical protein